MAPAHPSKLSSVDAAAAGPAPAPGPGAASPDPGMEAGAVVRFRRPGTRKRWVRGHLRSVGPDGSLDIFASDGGLRTVPAAWCERPAPSGGRPDAWEPVAPADGGAARRRHPAGAGRSQPTPPAG